MSSKICPKCKRPVEGKTTVCPFCGHTELGESVGD